MHRYTLQVAFVARAPRLLLMAHTTSLDLWQLPAQTRTASEQSKLIAEASDGDRVDVSDAAVRKLLQVMTNFLGCNCYVITVA
jgi:hypothetical protein